MNQIDVPFERAALRRKRVVVGGIRVDCLTAEQWTDLLVDDWENRRPTKVVTTSNGQVISLYAHHRDYRRAVNACDHVAADGMSVVTGSRIFTDTPLPERVPTTDWFHDAAAAASLHGMRFYLVGATEATIEAAATRIRLLYPELPLVGWRDGYFGDHEIGKLARDINNSGADVLWLGLGNPRQVILAQKLKPLLNHVVWIRTCGGLFDFLAQNNRRAPLFLQKAGLEWAWRTAMEPRRLFWRYFTTNLLASYLIVLRSSKRRRRT